MNVCKGICTRFKASSYKRRKRYENGQRLCSIRAHFLIYDDTRCPCCKVKLRITPRAGKARKNMQKRRKFVWD